MFYVKVLDLSKTYQMPFAVCRSDVWLSRSEEGRKETPYGPESNLSEPARTYRVKGLFGIRLAAISWLLLSANSSNFIIISRSGHRMVFEYAVIHFNAAPPDDGMEVVSTAWFADQGEEACYWPPGSRFTASKLAARHVRPDPAKWTLYKDIRVLGRAGMYEIVKMHFRTLYSNLIFSIYLVFRRSVLHIVHD